MTLEPEDLPVAFTLLALRGDRGGVMMHNNNNNNNCAVNIHLIS